jgi:hypothetical protein
MIGLTGFSVFPAFNGLNGLAQVPGDVVLVDENAVETGHRPAFRPVRSLVAIRGGGPAWPEDLALTPGVGHRCTCEIGA